jgi:putative hydrolase of the HAD superfamily
MKHLFFDLDNTLWDFDRNSKTVLHDLFHKKELSAKLGVDFETFHAFYYKKNDELWHLYYFNRIKKEELRYKRFYDSFFYFGWDDIGLSKDIAEEYVKISPYSKHLKEGCIEVLDHLNSGYHLHIITNGFAEVQNIKIDNCGLRNYFKQIIISEEHGLTKPHVDIFRLGEKLANTSADKCIMIGDNWVSDIEGAVGAGWKAVYFNEIPKEELPNISFINSLHQLKNIL